MLMSRSYRWETLHLFVNDFCKPRLSCPIKPVLSSRQATLRSTSFGPILNNDAPGESINVRSSQYILSRRPLLTNRPFEPRVKGSAKEKKFRPRKEEKGENSSGHTGSAPLLILLSHLPRQPFDRAKPSHRRRIPHNSRRLGA